MTISIANNRPAKIFNSVDLAQAAVAKLGFEDGELRVKADPKGSGRCIIEVIDLIDGAVIAHI